MTSDATLAPTDEQEAIIASTATPDPVMIQAYAGTAKTTSLALAAPGIRQPALALAFNKRIAEELRGRLPANWAVKTLNGLGHLAWIRSLPAVVSVKLDDRKLGRLITQNAKSAKLTLSSDQWDSTRVLVTAAMLAGLSPEDQGSPMVSDSPETWQGLAADAEIGPGDVGMLIELARNTLIDSIRLAREGVISFDDQVYCPTVLGGQWPRYPALAVDESQDLSRLNHRMIQLATRPDAKLLVVGDSRQAIYAFRGADASSMDSLRQLRSGWTDRKLTLTFRCPKVVVERQQRHAPGFRAAANNAAGSFHRFGVRAGETVSDETVGLGGWTWEKFCSLASLDASRAVLCRNNAPLLSLAFKLIRQGVGPSFAGRDLGKGLQALSRKIVPDDSTPAVAVWRLIEQWETSEKSLALAMQRPERLDSISDRAECLRAILDGAAAATAGALRAGIGLIFARDGADVTLSSIHRAKGLEWDCVMHLDPWRVPSRQARAAARDGNDGALQQEWNLLYVTETRTRDTLVNANLEDFQ